MLHRIHGYPIPSSHSHHKHALPVGPARASKTLDFNEILRHLPKWLNGQNQFSRAANSCKVVLKNHKLTLWIQILNAL